MVDTLLDMAVDSPVPILSGTHSIAYLIKIQIWIGYCTLAVWKYENLDFLVLIFNSVNLSINFLHFARRL